MGMLIDGQWCDDDRTIQDGAYVRPSSQFNEPLSSTVVKTLATEPGRFHLIASRSCPWSHRTTLLHALKKLRRLIPVHIARGPRTQGYRMGEAPSLWHVPGTDHRVEHLHEVYSLTQKGLTARATVPVLWDSQTRQIISNESTHILRGLDHTHIPSAPDVDWTFYPDHVRDDIDDLSHFIQAKLSNAVYRAGKARSQTAYDAAVADVFQTLDQLEDRLSQSRFLHGEGITLSDIQLWPTLVRFDLVYHGHFKCTLRRLATYPNLWAYTRDMLSWPGVAETFDPDAIRHAYYHEDRDLNPTGIVAIAPDIDWTEPSNRSELGPAQIWTRSGRLKPLHSAERV